MFFLNRKIILIYYINVVQNKRVPWLVQNNQKSWFWLSRIVLPPELRVKLGVDPQGNLVAIKKYKSSTATIRTMHE